MVVVFAWFAWLWFRLVVDGVYFVWFCLVVILMLGYVLRFVCWLLNSVVCLFIRFIVIGVCGLFWFKWGCFVDCDLLLVCALCCV